MQPLNPYRSGTGIVQRNTPKGSPVGPISVTLTIVWWLASFVFVIPGVMGNFSEEGFGAFLIFCGIAIILMGGTIAINAGVRWVWHRTIDVKLGDPVLYADAVNIQRGQSLRVEYRQSFKQQSVVQSIELKLICEEWVQYTQGTDTHTATHEIVADEQTYTGGTIEAEQTIKKQARLVVPPDAMHDLDYSRNKIRWYIAVHMALKAWPDFYEKYELVFNPPRGERRQ